MLRQWLLVSVMLAEVLLAANLPAEENAGTAPSVFSKAEDDGLLVASRDTWYLEEFDALGRPIVGTLWKKGLVAEKSSWLYPDDSQQAGTKIVTDSAGSVETVYDRSGNVSAKTTSDASGKTTEMVSNSYDEKNRLSVTETVTGDVTTRIEMKYGKGDEKEKKLYQNGMPVIMWNWNDEDNWTETIYHDGAAVLVVEYVHGVRKGTDHESKR